MKTPKPMNYLEWLMRLVDTYKSDPTMNRDVVVFDVGQLIQRVILDTELTTKVRKSLVRRSAPAEFYLSEKTGGLFYVVGITAEGVERRAQKQNCKEPLPFVPHRKKIYFDEGWHVAFAFEWLVKHSPKFERARVIDGQKELFDKRLLPVKDALDEIAVLHEQFGAGRQVEELTLFGDEGKAA